MERKVCHGLETKITDADQGIVETLFSVAGVLDDGDDVVWPGAFAKTFVERGSRIKVLDQHRTDSIMAVIGKPLAFKEIGRGELPPSVLAQFPDAQGAAWARVQFLMNTPEGKGAFERIKSGSIGEWSFGYDAIQADYSPIQKSDGTVINARNLRELKAYELSPVLWGMNPATATLSAKAADTEPEPDEGKPWRAVRGEDGKWRVYKLDADGQPTGEALGEYETQREAQAQIRALYANESDADKGGDMKADTKSGRVLAKRNAERLSRALAELNDVLKDAGLLEQQDEEESDADAEKASAAEPEQKEGEPNAVPPTPVGAGPDAEPPAYLSAVASLKLIELDLIQLEVQ